MFKAFPVINNTPNPYINVDDYNEAFIRTFGGMLNKIGRNRLVSTFKFKYDKYDGYDYMLVPDSDKDRDVSTITRQSARKYISNFVQTLTPIKPKVPKSPNPKPSIMETTASTVETTADIEAISNTIQASATVEQTTPSVAPTITPTQLFTPTPTPVVMPFVLHPYAQAIEKRDINNETTMEDKTAKYNKIDQPVALYLFFGRQRAEKIITEEISATKKT